MRRNDIPAKVELAILRKFAPDMQLADDILGRLEYSATMGCYYFNYAGMFHGVEPDGYIHT